MFRTIKIWLLLGRLQKLCHETEIKHSDHGSKKGHNFRASTPEQKFLDQVCGDNAKARAKCADLLELAEKKMKLVRSRESETKCKECNKRKVTKTIRLSQDGLEFVGFFDLIEYLLTKYKLTWSLFLAPVIAFFLGANFETVKNYITSFLVT